LIDNQNVHLHLAGEQKQIWQFVRDMVVWNERKRKKNIW